LSEYELFLSPRIEAPSLQLEVQVQIEVQETSINCQLIANQFQHSEQQKKLTKTETTITNSKTFHPSESQSYCTMMNLSLFLVFAALFNAATGNVIEDITPPTAGTPPGTSRGLRGTAPLSTPPATPPVELGTAGNYAILAKTGISTVPNSSIYGDVAVSPISHAAMTGFAMVMDLSGQRSSSSQINGKAYADDYATPTRSGLTTAVSDMETAYNDAAGRFNEDGDRTNIGAGDISGETLTPGVYTFDVDIMFSTDIAFKGDENDVFIMQTKQSLVQAANTKVELLGGVQAKNIFWQVAGNVRVGAGAQLQGVLLVKTDVLLMTGSYLNGRVLAQTACNLQMATIIEA
jgi:hypothetical protein